MERKDNGLEGFLESHVSSGDTFSNLYPALVECFGIILLGYVAGRYSMQLFFQFFTCVFQLSFCNDTQSLQISTLEWHVLFNLKKVNRNLQLVATDFRFRFISEVEAKGLSTFIGTFSLPALIFGNLITLDMTTVNWKFLVAIFCAKAIVFLAVLIVTSLIGHR